MQHTWPPFWYDVMRLCLLGVPCYWWAVCVIHSGSTRGLWFADGIDEKKCSSWHTYSFPLQSSL